MPEVEDDYESEIDEEEARREREREKIRQLKKRKIRTCGLKLPSLRTEGSAAVFVRHDMEDESMDVDISLGNDEGGNQAYSGTQPQKTTRVRRTTQNGIREDPPTPRPRKKARKAEPQKAPPKLSSEAPKDNGKPKPETYKQAWSVSEQHLLEQLLEQIPEGEKYR